MVDCKVAIHTTLLLVDDDKQQLELQSLVLKKSGFVVLSADSPIEALAILAQPHGRKVSVAILDYEMPVMNGCVLADYLKARYPCRSAPSSVFKAVQLRPCLSSRAPSTPAETRTADSDEDLRLPAAKTDEDRVRSSVRSASTRAA